MKQKITKELLPSKLGEKTWTTWNYFALWIGMNVAVATYYVCESYMQLGLSVWQVVFCIAFGCLVLVFPMAANGHAGTKYGVPSPVYWRSACGYLGSSATAIIRAAVAVFYFGIHLYIGAQCVDVAIRVIFPGWSDIPYAFAISFVAYWLLTVLVLTRGAGMLKKLESFTAPFLIIWMVVLLVWGRVNAGSWGTLISEPATISGGELRNQMLVCITATIGWWATLVLNITDFTRYSKSQKAHIIGTAVGNPIGFSGLALVGALVTSCSVVIFGEAIWDPIVLTSKINNPLFVVGTLLFLGAAEIYHQHCGQRLCTLHGYFHGFRRTAVLQAGCVDFRCCRPADAALEADDLSGTVRERISCLLRRLPGPSGRREYQQLYLYP